MNAAMSTLRLLLDARRAKQQGPAAMAERQRARLAAMVAYARAHSPYYRDLYWGLPERIEDPALLPVVSKEPLMARFDDWVTDRAVTIEQVRAFVDDPGLVGEQFLSTYTVATTSGTTGIRGIFLMDDRSMAVTTALAFRMMSAWVNAGDIFRIIAGRGRMAMVSAAGGHFASTIAATRLRQRRFGPAILFIPVYTPMSEMVARLNRFRPVIVAPYASVATLLAGEQEVSRLHINPALIVLAAEGLPPGEYDRIAEVFGAKVRHSYAATECPFLSYSCAHGWLHVNADWVVLEPVDTEHRPVPPGVQSHTVLVSNLANRVQPILRYDLGDSVLERPDPCPCGNPLPAIRVQGRAADALAFPTDRSGSVTIAPLSFSTLIDRIPGIALFQIVQAAPTRLRVRLRTAAGADPNVVWRAVHDAITHLLAGHALGHVTVERAAEPPEQTPGGKYRTIIPLRS